MVPRSTISIHSPLEQNGTLTFTLWSTDPVASTLTTFPSPPAPDIACRPHVMQVTNLSWASIVFVQRPFWRSQTFIVLSSDADKRYFPDGWNTRARIQLSWPFCWLADDRSESGGIRGKQRRGERVKRIGRRTRGLSRFDRLEEGQSEGEDIEKRKRDIQKSSTIDQSEYPINKSSYPANQSQQMLRAI